MRHRRKAIKLGRGRNQRKALEKVLAVSLILNGKIRTTLEKAKFVQGLVEKLITLSKTKSLISKHKINSLISNEKAEKKLFTELAEKYKERKGGYTRILKLKERKGDNALIVLIELI